MVSGDFDIAGAARALSIATVGTQFDGKIREGLIYRLDKAQKTAKYRHLVVSDDLEESADIILIKAFRRSKEKLKRKVKKGTGLEITIAPARKMDAVSVGKWFEDISELYAFCHSSRCQMILSSGAKSEYEMVSGPCFDAILRNSGIEPERHWQEINNWLEGRLSKRVYA